MSGFSFGPKGLGLTSRRALVAAGLTLLPAMAMAQGQPTHAWRLDGTTIQLAEGAESSPLDASGAREGERALISGAVRTGVRNASQGIFIGARPTRMVVTLRDFDGLSTGEALVAGGRFSGLLDLEMRDALTGEVLARQTGTPFSRVVASGFLGLGVAIAGGGAANETRIAQEVAVVTRRWLSSLDCADPSCTVATAIAPDPGVKIARVPGTQISTAQLSDPSTDTVVTTAVIPTARPEPVEPEIVVAELAPDAPIATPAPTATDGVESDDGGFFSSITSIFKDDEPETETADETPQPEPKPETEIAVLTPAPADPVPAAPVPAPVEPVAEEPADEPAPEAVVETPADPAPAEESGGILTAIDNLFTSDPDDPDPVEAPVEATPSIAPDAPPIPKAAPREPETEIAALTPAEPEEVEAAPLAPVEPAPIEIAEPEIDVTAAPAAPTVVTAAEPLVDVGGSEEPAITQPATPEAVAALEELDVPVASPRVVDDPEPDPNRIAVAPPAPEALSGEDSPTAALAPDDQGLAVGDAPSVPSADLATPTPTIAPPNEPEPEREPEVAVRPQPRPEPEVEPEVEPEEEAQVALVNPAVPVARPELLPNTSGSGPTIGGEAVAPEPADIVPEPPEPVSEVETQIAAVDPTAEGPTLANAQWIGFTPAVFGDSAGRAGLWIAGPFDRRERKGWITDTATGATTRVTLVWREAAPGSQALLSSEAARALGLAPGNVANVAVYVPR